MFVRLFYEGFAEGFKQLFQVLFYIYVLQDKKYDEVRVTLVANAGSRDVLPVRILQNHRNAACNK